MISFTNLDEFIGGINKAIVDIEREVTEVYRGYCVAAFHHVLMETPQWSGNAAANWEFGVDYESTSPIMTGLLNVSGAAIDPQAEKGLGAGYTAISMAISSNKGREMEIRDAGAQIYITNSSENLSNESYIEKLEENPNDFLRSANRPGHMVEYTVREFNAWSFDAKDAMTIENLQATRIGDFSGGAMA